MATRSDSDEQACRERALRLLETRPHSTHELARKLTGRGFAQSHVDLVTADLTRVGLLNDLEFAKAYCESRLSGGRATGPYRIKMDLRRRGVTEQIADEALLLARHETGDEDDTDRALALAVRKWPTMARSGDVQSAKARLYRFLSRRGFDGATTREVVDRVAAGD